MFEIGRGERPKIGWQDFTAFCNRTGMRDDKTIDLATLDRTFILTNVNMHGLFSSAERDLNRYEFIEILVRFANIRYKEKTHEVKTTVDAIERLMQECVYPNTRAADGW